MGESERYQEYRHADKKRYALGNPNNAIIALLILNAVFFLTLLTIRVFYLTNIQTIQEFNQNILSNVQLPSTWHLWLQKPWTLITYMFSDSSEQVWRLVSNIIWMASFAYLLQEQHENDKILPVYLYGGFVAGLTFIGCASLFLIEGSQHLLGANAAVVSVAVAATAYNPGYRFFRHLGQGIPVWVLLILYLFVDFFQIKSFYFQ